MFLTCFGRVSSFSLDVPQDDSEEGRCSGEICQEVEANENPFSQLNKDILAIIDPLLTSFKDEMIDELKQLKTTTIKCDCCSIEQGVPVVVHIALTTLEKH